MSTSNQLGDANEAYFQHYIEEIYAAAHPQFIENTKYDRLNWHASKCTTDQESL